MRRTLQELRENLEEFVQQAERSLLLIGSSDNDVAYLLKTQEQLQGEDAGSIYLAYADEFVDADSYTLGLAQRLSDLLLIGNEQRVAENREKLEPFPEAMLAPSTLARRRIVMALEHMKQWLAQPGEQHVVLTLVPLRLPPHHGYFAFLGEFAQYGEPEPWMPYGRLIFRDDRATHVTGGTLAKLGARNVLTFDIDFSTDKLAADMSAEAVDPAVPLAQRMQAHLQLAAIDVSYKRYDEAISKYGVLFQYYGLVEAPIMQALCLLGVGDVLRSAGRVAEAKVRYQQGLALIMQTPSPVPLASPPLEDGSPNPAPAMHPSAPPVMLNLLLAAGESSMSLAHFEDARTFFESAAKMGAKCMNPFATADALERQGDAELALGQSGPALKSWQDAHKIAEMYDHPMRAESVLERQRKLYESAAMRAEADKVARQIELARFKRAQGTPA